VHGQVGSAADGGNHSIVSDRRVGELVRRMAGGAKEPADGLRLKIEKEVTPPGLAVGEVRNPGGEPGVELRIERLDAADKLGERFLDSRLIDSGRAERDIEKRLVLGQSGQFRDELRKIRIAIAPAESHLKLTAD